MPEANIFTLILVALFAGTLAYQSSFFKNKTIGKFSLLQILYLVVIPGFIFSFFFSYLQAITERPLAEKIFLPDKVLVNITLLATLFSYGGTAIHATSKMLSEILKKQSGQAKDLNKYFHLNFSHNLVYSGVIAAIVCTSLLELNHPSPNSLTNPTPAIIKGIIMGLSLTMGMLWYTRSDDEEYIGRWSDLKTTFLVIWIGAALIFYGVKRTNPSFHKYDTLIPTLASLIIIAPLNFFLVYRRLKRGGFRLYFYFGKIKRLLFQFKL